MTMLAETVDAVIGIDTHRDSHEVEIADDGSSAARTRSPAPVATKLPGARWLLDIPIVWIFHA
jgi:hypothetical protein